MNDDNQNINVRECSQLRKDCQKEIFNKLDKHHNELMVEIGEIKTEMAYMQGEKEGIAYKSKDKINWTKTSLRILIMYGPYLAFFLVLGLVLWLKSEGYL